MAEKEVRNLFLRAWDIIAEFMEDEEENNEPTYDPAHIGAMIVLVLLGISVLFWLFWSLLVFKGGLIEKIYPLISVIFNQKKLADFGYQYWHDQGIFEGWVTNLCALIFLFLLIWGIWSVFKKTEKKEGGDFTENVKH